MSTMTVLFYALLVSRERSDGYVLAEVDGHTVRWRTRDGWTCDCPVLDWGTCVHVDAVAALIHPDVQHRMTAATATHTERGIRA